MPTNPARPVSLIIEPLRRGALLRVLAAIALALGAAGGPAAAQVVLNATSYGVQADGVTDDGPAIATALAAAIGQGQPVRLLFPAGATVRATSAADRYVFDMDAAATEIEIDGAGCHFVLGPDVRFMRADGASTLTVRNLTVDFDPLPFADATITAVNQAGGYIDVEAAPWVDQLPTGGPTYQDGEQAFFAMLWYDGPYDLMGMHYYVDDMQPGPTSRTARVYAQSNFTAWSSIVPGQWRVSLPVPGVAHRYGPGECFQLVNSTDLLFEDIELWSAPWFGFGVARNDGQATFRRVNIRPRTGSERLTSLWRDGFHVKGNRAGLLWEDCHLRGMNDDAFNISNTCSRVREIISPTLIKVRQSSTFNYIPWLVGDTLVAADFDGGTRLGEATVLSATLDPPVWVNGQPATVDVALELDQAITDLELDSMVWMREVANPDTILRDCTIEMSCRMQHPMTIENCDVTALLWFYAEEVEGPFPSDFTVRDSVLRRGRGNPTWAIVVSGRNPSDPRPSAVHDILFEDNEVWGGFSMTGADDVQLLDNRFDLEPGAVVSLQHCRNLYRRDWQTGAARARLYE